MIRSRLRRALPGAVFAAFGIVVALPGAAADFTLDVDLVSASQARNTVQIPNTAAGTRFSLVDVLGQSAQTAARLTLVTSGLRPGQQWRFLAAPLTIDGSGRLDRTVQFNGETFAPGPVDATYTFNSYRVTYRWPLSETRDWRWHWGVTGKIRDAQIGLRQGGTGASKSNTGFVPLLHLAGEGRSGRWRFSFDADGLASPQGRAFDLGARVGYEVGPSVDLFGGIRMIDGGADNDEVYNFARIDQLTLGLRTRF